MEAIKISVPTIKCGGCVAAVRDALEGVAGVSGVSVELESKTAEFVLAGEARLDDALGAVVEAGHRATPV
jgi:Cu+-exporting ATPase